MGTVVDRLPACGRRWIELIEGRRVICPFSSTSLICIFFLHLVEVLREHPSGSVVKNPPAVQDLQEMQVQSLGGEDPLEEGMAAHSSILGWRIPWTEEPGRQQSRGSQSQTRLK